jgi:hypothetical protein
MWLTALVELGIEQDEDTEESQGDKEATEGAAFGLVKEMGAVRCCVPANIRCTTV